MQERLAFAVTPPTSRFIIITQPNTAETAAGKICRPRRDAQRLQRLNVESLEERRIKFDLHTIFKIVHKLVDINDELFIRSVESLNLRGHNQRFLKPQVRLNCRAHSFACRNINVWNSLPQAAVDCKSLVAFKNALNELSFSKYLHLEP